MFGMDLKTMQAGFFDRSKIIRSVDRAARQVLSKFGAFVRTAARSSIRKRKKASEPGKPPSSHVGTLKQFIYFAYEPGSRNVVIGPTRINTSTGEPPHALEYGGLTTDMRVKRKRRGRPRTVQKRRVVIKARPYMHPARDKELPKLPALWANSVKP